MLTGMKEETDSKTITAEDLNTLHQWTNRSSRQKINKETQALNNALNQCKLYLQSIPSKSNRMYILLKCT